MGKVIKHPDGVELEEVEVATPDDCEPTIGPNDRCLIPVGRYRLDVPLWVGKKGNLMEALTVAYAEGRLHLETANEDNG